MGSESDWESTMQHACATLKTLEIPHEKRVTSAHRTPDVVEQYAKTARIRGIKVIIAGAGGAAHLPGMVAAQSGGVPVIGVPVESASLKGMDSLLSIVQMPPKIPVGTMSIGKPGAINAAVYAAQMLGISDDAILHRLEEFYEAMRREVAGMDKKISDI